MAPKNEMESPVKPQPKRLNAVSRFTKTFSLSRKLKKQREGKLVETLDGHEGGINCMAMSADESILVTGSEDCTARVWAIADETIEDKCLGVLEGHTSYITCVAILDRYVFTGSADGDIRKWDIATCECDFVYKGHNSKIHKILVTEDLIFSTSHDKTAKVWYNNVEDRRPCIRTFKGHGHGVYPLVYIPYVPEDDDEEDVQDDHDNEEAEIHPKDLLITGSADTSIKIWSLFSGECLETLRNHVGSVTALATDPKGKVLYSCGADSFIRYWDLATRRQIKSIDAHRSAIVSMHINRRLMYTGSQDGAAKCWVTEFGDNTVTYKGHTMSVTVIKFYKGLVITGCGDGIIRCFDAKSGHLLRTFSGHDGAVMSLSMTKDKIYSTTTDGSVRVFHIDWEFVRTYLAVLSGDIETVLSEDNEFLKDNKETRNDLTVVPDPLVSSRKSSVASAASLESSEGVETEEDNIKDVEDEENEDGDSEEEEKSGDESEAEKSGEDETAEDNDDEDDEKDDDNDDEDDETDDDNDDDK